METILPGKLVVRHITDRNGSVIKKATLRNSLGKFHVKSYQLKTLQPGEYDGFFTLAKVDPCCQHQQGKFLLGVVVTIEKMAFISQPQILPSTEVTETKTPSQLSLLQEENEEPEENEENIETDNDTLSSSAPIITQTRLSDDDLEDKDEQLFGSLYPLGEEVELDALQDRQILRQQADRLKDMGYQLNPKAQKWSLHFFE